MATHSSGSPASKSSGSAARKRTPNVIGAVAGAVIGGVLGAIVVKKVREQGGAKRFVPAKVPVLAKRAAGAVKSLAHDAKSVAKATAVIAADAALDQVKNAAQQFVVDVASGQPPAPPRPVATPASDAPTPPESAAQPAEVPVTSAPRKRASGKPAAKKASVTRKKSRTPKKQAKTAKARASH